MITKSQEYYVICAKDSPKSIALANVNDEFQAFNTWKFKTFLAALAFAEKQGVNPKYFEIRLMKFNVKFISKHEIKYESTR